jgi:hypothetical protein
MNKAAHEPRVSALTWTCISLLHRYFALSLDLFQAFMPDERRDTLRVTLDRQCTTWLCRTELEDRQPCYALGRRGQQWFGLRSKRGFPFAKDSLLKHVGIATFCALAGYRRVIKDEFASLFPEVQRKGQGTDRFCVDEKSPERLAWIVVDRPTAAQQFHGKLTTFIAKRYQNDGLERLIAEERLQLVIVTAEERKAEQIRAHLYERNRLDAPVSVIPIPSLLQFMF